MDVLGATSAVVGIVSFCGKCTLLLAQYVVEVRQIEGRIGDLCDEVGALQSLSLSVQQTWERSVLPQRGVAQDPQEQCLWQQVQKALINASKAVASLAELLEGFGLYTSKKWKLQARLRNQFMMSVRTGRINDFRAKLGLLYSSISAPLHMITICLLLRNEPRRDEIETLVRELLEQLHTGQIVPRNGPETTQEGTESPLKDLSYIAKDVQALRLLQDSHGKGYMEMQERARKMSLTLAEVRSMVQKLTPTFETRTRHKTSLRNKRDASAGDQIQRISVIVHSILENMASLHETVAKMQTILQSSRSSGKKSREDDDIYSHASVIFKCAAEFQSSSSTSSNCRSSISTDKNSSTGLNSPPFCPTSTAKALRPSSSISDTLRDAIYRWIPSVTPEDKDKNKDVVDRRAPEKISHEQMLHQKRIEKASQQIASGEISSASKDLETVLTRLESAPKSETTSTAIADTKLLLAVACAKQDAIDRAILLLSAAEISRHASKSLVSNARCAVAQRYMQLGRFQLAESMAIGKGNAGNHKQDIASSSLLVLAELALFRGDPGAAVEKALTAAETEFHQHGQKSADYQKAAQILVEAYAREENTFETQIWNEFLVSPISIPLAKFLAWSREIDGRILQAQYADAATTARTYFEKYHGLSVSEEISMLCGVLEDNRHKQDGVDDNERSPVPRYMWDQIVAGLKRKTPNAIIGNAQGFSILHFLSWTKSEGNVEIIQYMLRNGGIPNGTYDEHEHQIGAGDLHWLTGEDEEARWLEKVTPLMLACARGNLGVVQVLVQEGADVNAETSEGQSALHFLARFCITSSVETAQQLIDAGATIDGVDKKLKTPLHHSICAGNVPLVKLLLLSGANSRARTITYSNSIHLAAGLRHGNKAVEIMQLLSPTASQLRQDLDKSRRLAIHYAAVGSAAAIDFISKIVPSASTKIIGDAAGYHPLHVAAIADRADCFDALIRNNHSIEAEMMREDDLGNGLERVGHTPLELTYGIKGPSTTSAEILAYYSRKYPQLCRAAFFARGTRPPYVRILCERGATEGLKILLDHFPLHMTINSTIASGKWDRPRPLIHDAFAHGNLSHVRLLLDKGSNLVAVDADGNNALHNIAQRSLKMKGQLYNTLPHIIELYDQVSLLEVRNKKGMTALHIACMEGNESMAHFLIEYGASIWSTCLSPKLRSSSRALSTVKSLSFTTSLLSRISTIEPGLRLQMDTISLTAAFARTSKEVQLRVISMLCEKAAEGSESWLFDNSEILERLLSYQILPEIWEVILRKGVGKRIVCSIDTGLLSTFVHRLPSEAARQLSSRGWNEWVAEMDLSNEIGKTIQV